MLKSQEIAEKNPVRSSPVNRISGNKRHARSYSSPFLRMVKAETEITRRMIETETRKKRLLLDELMCAETLVEKQFIIELLNLSNATRQNLEEKHVRFRKVIRLIESKIDDYKDLLLPEEIEYLNKTSAGMKADYAERYGLSYYISPTS